MTPATLLTLLAVSAPAPRLLAGPEMAPGQVDPQQAIERLQQAQVAAAEGRTEEALELLDQALTLQETLAAAYLTRAQLLVESLGDLEQAATRADELDPQWPARARQAAVDLERYLAIEQREDTGIEAHRTALLVAADAVERAWADAEEPIEPVEPQPPPPPPQPGIPPVSLGLLASGSLLTATGAGLLSGGLRMGRQCRGTDCITVDWHPSVPLLAPGAVASLAGAGLATTGAILLARRTAGTKRRRGVAAGVLASAGLAVIGSAVLGGLATQRWNGHDPNDRDGLSRTQSMANASLAIGSTIPALLGAGIGLLLPPRADRP